MSTHEDVLPATIASPEEQSMLPEVRGDGPVRLQVDEVGVACSWVPESPNAKSEILVI